MITYLCGGIFGLQDTDIRCWRATAKQQLHGSVIDPLDHDYRGKEDQHVDRIVSNDLDAIRWSDGLLVNAQRPSWGTAMELVYAKQWQKYIVAFTGPGQISPWLRWHCSRIVPTLKEAIDVINAGQ